jgi:hypothetical protein
VPALLSAFSVSGEREGTFTADDVDTFFKVYT